MKKIITLLFVTLFMFTSCRDSEVASRNLSKAADQFEIYRRVIFYNGITDKYILSVEGYCSVKTEQGQLTVTIKTKDGKYLKHFLGLSDNVTYFSQQLQSAEVSVDRYRVIFKPSVIVPNVDVE